MAPSTATTSTPRPVALVTGAARRIGRAITLHLAAHGWDVVLHHRGSAQGAADAEATAAEARVLGAAAWLVAARALHHKIYHHLEDEENRVFQLAGKVLGEDEKLSLAQDYEAEFVSQRLKG